MPVMLCQCGKERKFSVLRDQATYVRGNDIRSLNGHVVQRRADGSSANRACIATRHGH